MGILRAAEEEPVRGPDLGAQLGDRRGKDGPLAVQVRVEVGQTAESAIEGNLDVRRGQEAGGAEYRRVRGDRPQAA
jgi:hypothetical protein